jgi:hypothetical protein
MGCSIPVATGTKQIFRNEKGGPERGDESPDGLHRPLAKIEGGWYDILIIPPARSPSRKGLCDAIGDV